MRPRTIGLRGRERTDLRPIATLGDGDVASQASGRSSSSTHFARNLDTGGVRGGGVFGFLFWGSPPDDAGGASPRDHLRQHLASVGSTARRRPRSPRWRPTPSSSSRRLIRAGRLLASRSEVSVAQDITSPLPIWSATSLLASSAPQGAAGMHGWSPDVIRKSRASRGLCPRCLPRLRSTRNVHSQQAGVSPAPAELRRPARKSRDADTTWQTRRGAVRTRSVSWGGPTNAARL